ncbi:ChiQ/YbfN family lipoprotein [Edwardsiella tarda]|uniref:ChiQ/YbfN family lipoprotein n=1 Tax=Edwardsiella tarda TaxID=636 RepID=UPI00351C1001
MKAILGVAVAAIVLAGCVQPSAPSQDGQLLKQAYSKCIEDSKGNHDKVASCKTILDVMKQSPAQATFAQKESVSVLNYQQCIEAAMSGAGDNYTARCGTLWQEIRASNAN